VEIVHGFEVDRDSGFRQTLASELMNRLVEKRNAKTFAGIPLSWIFSGMGEMDSLQHVNNIVYFRYFESVRMAFFDRIEFWPSINESGIGQSLVNEL